MLLGPICWVHFSPGNPRSFRGNHCISPAARNVFRLFSERLRAVIQRGMGSLLLIRENRALDAGNKQRYHTSVLQFLCELQGCVAVKVSSARVCPCLEELRD
jgi:hypothetical protein